MESDQYPSETFHDPVLLKTYQSLQGETRGFALSLDTQAVHMAGDCSVPELQTPSLWIQQSVMDELNSSLLKGVVQAAQRVCVAEPGSLLFTWRDNKQCIVSSGGHSG